MKTVKFNIENPCPRRPNPFNKSYLNIFIRTTTTVSFLETQIKEYDPIMQPKEYKEPIWINFKGD